METNGRFRRLESVELCALEYSPPGDNVQLRELGPCHRCPAG